MTSLTIGDPSLLGATVTDEGINFSLYSAHADAVELCVFDESGDQQIGEWFLPECRDDIWSGFLPGGTAGTCYAYRVHGPYSPGSGHRFNPSKLLLDPYARVLRGTVREDPALYSYDRDPDGRVLESRNTLDSAPYVPRGVAVNSLGVAAAGPGHNWKNSAIYELHLKGFTQRHSGIPEAERGKILGLANDKIICYLKSLGITAVELLPIQAFISESFLAERGLSNYWGYNTLSWFALHTAYAGSAPRAEFRHLVEQLHEAGLEVILDVVYNHSCEGSELGPTLSLRGIDNPTYYRLEHGAPARYVNDTGCGNTLALDNWAVRRLVRDSLRYWVQEFGVDGFRFDLATTLGRSAHGFDSCSALISQLERDPVLKRCKFIAEPWDVGPGGYQLGGFPRGFSEWNDRYRDSLRRFWRGDEGEIAELATRIHGSSDVFESRDRLPWASTNFVCSHDGFTLRDLVSYSHPHNHANGEQNRDGHRENYSDNCGMEGPTDDARVDQIRRQRERALIATLLLSQGVPMLLAGAELGHTQLGNNNAYCQDNATSWIDWDNEDQDLQKFTCSVMAFRHSQPLLGADCYRHATPNSDGQSLRWFAPEGGIMEPSDWASTSRRCVGCLLTQHETDDAPASSLLILLNSQRESLVFALPQALQWHRRIDTAEAPWMFDNESSRSESFMAGQSVQVLESDGALAA
ncbi:MAG: glycogen debranching protein GlgX [Pseudomonadota bacterium]